MASNVKGFAGSARIAQLKTRADLRASARHGMRLDKSGKERAIRDAKPLTRSGLNVVDLYDKHVEGLFVQKNSTMAMHILIQFPKLLVDENDPDLMLDHAIAFCRHVFGESSVFADRVDRDEKNQHVVDVFVAPTYQKVTKHTSKPAVSSTRHLKALAKKHSEPPVPQGFGRALQTEFFEYLRDTMKLEGVMRGEKKVIPGSDFKTAEQQRLDELNGRLSEAKAVIDHYHEERAANREREIELDGREKDLSERKTALDSQASGQAETASSLADQWRRLKVGQRELAEKRDEAEQAKRANGAKVAELAEREKSLRAREAEIVRGDGASQKAQAALQTKQQELDEREKFADAFQAGIDHLVSGELSYGKRADQSTGLRSKSGRSAELTKLIMPAMEKVREIARTVSEHITAQVEKEVSEERGVLASLQKAYRAAIEQNRLFAESFRIAMAKLDRDARKRALTEKSVHEAAEATQAVESADAIEPAVEWSLEEIEYLKRQQAQGR